MALKRLIVNNLRNLTAVDIELSSSLNIIYGQNGSGKTSLLEAISLLGLGRSFRSRKLRPLINDRALSLTVFAEMHRLGRCINVGLQREATGSSLIKVDGKLVNSAAILAENLPLQLIDAHSFSLLEGPPTLRRQFMDWLVFHVEPEFLVIWQSAQRCIKHRNMLLRRDKIDRLELSLWDKKLATLAHQIDTRRSAVFTAFKEYLLEHLAQVLSLTNLELDYFPGWDAREDYLTSLGKSFIQDRERGYTRFGPHRADIKIRVAKQSAVEVLSRGQQKLLVCALKIGQGAVFQQYSGDQCVYLLDDFPAELDRSHRQRVTAWLDKVGAQIFITGIEKRGIMDSWEDNKDQYSKLFHVEQGHVGLDVECIQV